MGEWFPHGQEKVKEEKNLSGIAECVSRGAGFFSDVTFTCSRPYPTYFLLLAGPEKSLQ